MRFEVPVADHAALVAIAGDRGLTLSATARQLLREEAVCRDLPCPEHRRATPRPGARRRRSAAADVDAPLPPLSAEDVETVALRRVGAAVLSEILTPSSLRWRPRALRAWLAGTDGAFWAAAAGIDERLAEVQPWALTATQIEAVADLATGKVELSDLDPKLCRSLFGPLDVTTATARSATVRRHAVRFMEDYLRDGREVSACVAAPSDAVHAGRLSS